MPHSKFMMKFKKNQKVFLSGILLAGLSMTIPVSMAETYQTIYHVVEANETLSGLSKKFNIPIDNIKKLNGKDNSDLAVGERLLLPINTVTVNGNTAKIVKAKTTKKSTSTKAKTKIKMRKSTKKTIKPEAKLTTIQKYRVQSGDNLSAIALQYNTTVADITKANNITEEYILMINDLLLIPTKATAKQLATKKQAISKSNNVKTTKNVTIPKKTEAKPNETDTMDVPFVYEVVSGDVLGSIADRYKLNLAEIIELNSLENMDSLSIGQKLTLRKKKEVRPSMDYSKIANANTY